RSARCSLLDTAEHGVPRVEPPAINRSETGVSQPDQMMQDRGGPIVWIGKSEVIPALVLKLPEQRWRVERVRLCARRRVPSIGGNPPPPPGRRLDQIPRPQRPAR